MATIISIKQKIDQLNPGSFQALCDDYLSREGYHNLVALGTKAGTAKTTPGTPDTYFCQLGGKYVFAEYTIQKDGLENKIRSDLEKCFNVDYTGISIDEILEIVYCHTSSNLTPRADRELKQYCEDEGVLLRLIGIDILADDIYRKYQILAKEHLGLTVDTEQIQTPEDFVKHYDSNELAAPLSTSFQFRENELQRLSQAFEESDIVILSGKAGTGKTRLALEFAERYKQKHGATVYVIHNHGLGIFDDLKQYFELPGDYFVIVDDANQISELSLIIEYVNKKSERYNVKILVTVRSYALQKVKSDIIGIARFKEIKIGIFSDEKIKTLIKAVYGIQNEQFLNRIARISEGNARIAVLAGKIAIEANSLSSINDVTDLYSAYYGKAFSTAGMDEDQQLQITAGVISFLGSARLDHLDMLMPLLARYNIDLSVFIDCSHRLHEMELVDICRDKAVVISDQCFANFILKHVFVDKKSINLSEMLEVCFRFHRERTISSVNTILGVFQNQDVYDFVENSIKTVWEKLKAEQSPYYWDWVKAFFPVNPEEALFLVKERIENTEKVSLHIDDIDIEKGKNNQVIRDDLIEILGGFADNENLDTALDLLFEYYLKRPDLYIQFYHAINRYFSITQSSLKYGFYTQKSLIKHFTDYSDNWNNPFIRVLFFEAAKELLKVEFSPGETGRKMHSIVWYNIALPYSEYTTAYRALIWEQLLSIQEKTDSHEAISALLRNYNRGINEQSYGVIKEDSVYICSLLEKGFSTEKLGDCLIAEHLNSIFNIVGCNSEIIEKFLQSRKMKLYRLLAGPEWDLISDFDERDLERNRLVIEYMEQSEDYMAAFNMLFEVWRECAALDGYTVYQVGEGFNCAIMYLLKNKPDREEVAKMIITCELINSINIHGIVRELFVYYSPDEVKSFISLAPPKCIDYWMFAYFYEYPEELITENVVSQLYDYFKCDYDRSIDSCGQRPLKFLDKYEKADQDVFIKSVKLLFAKREYSPCMVSMYLKPLFIKQLYAPDCVIQRFSDNLSFLEEIHTFISLYGTLVRGSFLKELCMIDSSYAKKYVIAHLNSKRSLHGDDIGLSTLFDCENYIEIIDSVVNECVSLKSAFYRSHEIVQKFICIPEALISKSDEWIRHYISKYNDDIEKMEFLFRDISDLPPERKIEYITMIVNLNDDPKLFKKIRLTPTSYSWTGSAVPVYSEQISYLEKLLPIFQGLRFLEHKRIVKEEIEMLKARIERAEIDDILNG